MNRPLARGLTAYGNYVWAKTLKNVESSLMGDNSGRPLDYYNLKLEKGISANDVPHTVKIYVDYELPIGRGKALGGGMGKVAGAILGDWSISAILNYSSGAPLTFVGSSPLTTGWNGVTNRINIAPGEMKRSGLSPAAFEFSTPNSPNNTYLNNALFSDAAPLTLGTAAYTYAQARSLPRKSEDAGLQKAFRVGDKYRFQLRAEFLNPLNRHQLGNIVTNITSPQFGQLIGASGFRSIQIGTRLDF